MKSRTIKLICLIMIIFAVSATGKVYAVLTSDAYMVDHDKYCIYDILPNTTVKEIKENLKEDVKIYNNKDIELTDEIIVGSGMILKLSDGNEYKLSIRGDLSGDGIITVTDLLRLKKVLIGIEDVYTYKLYAMDTNEDRKLTSTDIMQTKRQQVGLIPLKIKEKGIIIETESVSVNLSDSSTSKTVVARVVPATSNGKIVWSSSDLSVAEVDNEGKITAKNNGKTTVIAKTQSEITEQCEILVYTTPTGVTLNETEKTLDLDGELDFQLVPNIVPSTANQKNKVTYTSENENVATVDSSGKITGYEFGETIIRVKTENGKEAQLKVNVTGKDLGGMTIASTIVTVNNNEIKFNYWIYIPKLENVKTYKNIPLIMYLHGSGEGYVSGKTMEDNMKTVLNISLPKYLYRGEIAPNAIIVAPQCPAASNWGIKSVMQIIENIKSMYEINEDKISITGHSLGASGAWRAATLNPNTFSACVPVSCQTNDYMSSVSQFPNCRVRFIFEADPDSANKKPATKKFVAAVQAEKGEDAATYEYIKGTSHGSVTKQYLETDLVQWMINQTRRIITK